MYVLQSEAESPGVLPGKVAGVQLLYARNSVLVRPSNGGAPVRFTVAGKESVGAAGARPLDWSGYGLARRTGQWPLVDGVPLQEALKTPLAASCGAASGGAQLMGSCDSGGCGIHLMQHSLHDCWRKLLRQLWSGVFFVLHEGRVHLYVREGLVA